MLPDFHSLVASKAKVGVINLTIVFFEAYVINRLLDNLIVNWTSTLEEATDLHLQSHIIVTLNKKAFYTTAFQLLFKEYFLSTLPLAVTCILQPVTCSPQQWLLAVSC
jgi:hypothetical protein